MRVVELIEGWGVVQDVRDQGERLGLYRPDFDPYRAGPAVSPWQPIPRLVHLQVLFARQPYFGRELRHFNEHPWWYRLEFDTPEEAGDFAQLCFEGVDYFATVWLNGELLGEHEGYFEAFSFEVGHLLRRDARNVLVVKVSAPWDAGGKPGAEEDIIFTVFRNQIKGTYEHADTFVQRDVNPIGIWRPVRLVLDDGVRAQEEPCVTTEVADDAAVVRVTWPVEARAGEREVEFRVRVSSEATGRPVAESTQTVTLSPEGTGLEASLHIASPELWSTWDRGGPALYRAVLEIREGDTVRLSREVCFGIRTVEIRRTAEETTFLLNGKPLFLRGTSYFPDVYLSTLDRARYERDLRAMVQAGMNAVRVHVHTENPECYELCDRLGLVVLQDLDLNWVFPVEEPFIVRAEAALRAMIRKLRNHPSITCWVTINEGWIGPEVGLAQRLFAEAQRFDPTRPAIRNSGQRDDPGSGDGHDYAGSLGGGAYTDIYGRTEKLNTEFGVDAPPAVERARLAPEVAAALATVLPRVAELHDYCYRLLKYFLEHYRMQKYAPCSGYFQFMWIDLCPQSFYGIYDYWGAPKVEGLGGGLRALQESNQPIGIFLEHKEGPVALWAVNDLPRDLGACRAEWTVLDQQTGEVLVQGEQEVCVGPDARARVGDLAFAVNPEVRYRILLNLYGPDGARLAHNVYEDAFHHPARPEGHPARMDHELGMRLWWGGDRA